MTKEEFIKKYGIKAHEKKLKRDRGWRKYHPEKAKIARREGQTPGGKYYEARLIYNHTGIQGERNKVRHAHGKLYRPFKKIIATASQIHHQWIPGTADYTGVALVEADQHQYGIIDPIVILEGEITLFTEAEIRAK